MSKFDLLICNNTEKCKHKKEAKRLLIEACKPHYCRFNNDSWRCSIAQEEVKCIPVITDWDK